MFDEVEEKSPEDYIELEKTTSAIRLEASLSRALNRLKVN